MRKKGRKIKKSVGKFFRKLLVLVLFLLTFLGGSALIYYVFDDNIHSIVINGNTSLTDKEVISLAKLDNYPSYFKTSSLTIKKNLMKSPYIKDAKVKKRLFYSVLIEIEEKNILFYRTDTKKLVFEDGNELELDQTYQNNQVPLLINYVPDTKYTDFINKYNKIDSKIRSKISEIEYSPNEFDEDRFILYMNDKNTVHVTLTKFNILNQYNKAITKLEGKVGTLYFDSGNYFKYN